MKNFTCIKDSDAGEVLVLFAEAGADQKIRLIRNLYVIVLLKETVEVIIKFIESWPKVSEIQFNTLLHNKDCVVDDKCCRRQVLSCRRMNCGG